MKIYDEHQELVGELESCRGCRLDNQLSCLCKKCFARPDNKSERKNYTPAPAPAPKAVKHPDCFGCKFNQCPLTDALAVTVKTPRPRTERAINQ
jgi:hypothetical protein